VCGLDLNSRVDIISSSPHAPGVFNANPKARADRKPGTVYAVTGEHGWIYYGQIAPDKHVGFFRFRGRHLEAPQPALAHPVMCVVAVAYPSIGRALRSGQWKKLGRLPLASSLGLPRLRVQWPEGTLTVTVTSGDNAYETRVDDPAIQDAELMAVWDAQYHVPARLTADFGAEEAEWHVGGPIWRERKVKEEYARRFPDAPYNRLPADWVPTKAR
jgi:hypothetical protein